MKVLMIGNGIAALSAAESFRKFDTEAEVLILSTDQYPTYYRLKLSHYLAKDGFTDEELYVKPESWYRDKGIAVRLNTTVKAVDFEGRAVTTAAGERIPYDRLLLATGAHPFVPPVTGADKQGVFTLRHLEDLKAIHHWLRDRQRVVVIGGGLLGLEAAHGLRELGRQVNVLEFFDYLLPRQLDAELSAVVQEQLEAEGLGFTLGTSCEEILGDEAVTGVRLKNGEILEADAVIFSAGVRPNTGLFAGTSLAVDRGIVVNDRMETNLPGVFAAGDAVQYQGTVFGLWTASNEQGKIAGANLAGEDLRYSAPQLVATLNIGQVKLFSAGDVSEPEMTATHRAEGAFHRIFIKGGRVTGAALTGDLSLMLKAKNLVLEKRAVDAGAENLFAALMGL